MAIVKEIQTGTAVVKIDDSCCRDLSRDELARRWSIVDREIMRINRAHQARCEREEGMKPCRP